MKKDARGGGARLHDCKICEQSGELENGTEHYKENVQ